MGSLAFWAGFLLRRLLQAAGVMLVVALLAFVLFQFVGDPVSHLAGPDATEAMRQQLRHDLGLDRPWPVQFLSFVEQGLRGEFGVSLRQGRPVRLLLTEALPATLELAGVAGLLALLLGIPLGVLAALSRGRAWAQWLMAASLLGVSLPGFLFGILFILLFSVQCQWLPSFGRGPVVALGSGWTTGLLTWEGWRHLAMPAVTLAVYQVAMIMRLVRAELLEVLRTDYIRFALARGLPLRTVYFGQALKNALVPVITIAALQLGGLVAFSILTETVFQWPGLGALFVQSIQYADVPVMAAYLCLVALVFVSVNLLADLLYAAVDPRMRAAAAGAPA